MISILSVPSSDMAASLDHTIVPARDKAASARFLADLLGLTVGADQGPFTPVTLDGDVTLDFAETPEPTVGHWAFRVDDATFDNAMAQVSAGSLPYASGPHTGWNHEIDTSGGHRRVYVQDPNGHAYEFFTR
jgi:catechol 2,3-dioxygenase-like lactoylglutathione lyase family enzyme